MESKLGQYWRKVNQWFYRTADRALDEAYKAALKIKAIEDEHFGGKNIAISATNNQVATYFQNDLHKYLKIVRIRLAEFQTSRTVTGNNYPQPPDSQQFDSQGFNDINPYTQDIEYEARILEKLSFIDDILTRYAENTQPAANPDTQRSNFGQRAIDFIAPPGEGSSLALDRSAPANLTNTPSSTIGGRQSDNMPIRPERSDDNINKKPIIDPSLISTFRRIQQDLNPKAEIQVIQNYRFNQTKTRSALRFILLLILVPLLVQYISKIVLVGPIVDSYRTYHHSDVFLNVNLEQEAFEQLEMFEKNLRFKHIVGLTPKLTAEQMEGKIGHFAVPTNPSTAIRFFVVRLEADALGVRVRGAGVLFTVEDYDGGVHEFGPAAWNRPSFATASAHVHTRRTAQRLAWRDVGNHRIDPGSQDDAATVLRFICCRGFAGARVADRRQLWRQRLDPGTVCAVMGPPVRSTSASAYAAHHRMGHLGLRPHAGLHGAGQ